VSVFDARDNDVKISTLIQAPILVHSYVYSGLLNLSLAKLAGNMIKVTVTITSYA